MDEGRVAGTSDIWDATQIANYEDVDAVEWECPGCTLRVFPVAWKPGQYKVTAHFKKGPGVQHHPKCQYDLMSKGGRRSLAKGTMGKPKSWIDRISFPVARILSKRPATANRINRMPPTQVTHSSTRHSIGAACRFHAALSGQRFNWPLRVDDVEGSNYFDVFELARSFPKKDKETRIWFGKLRVRANIEADDQVIRILLMETVLVGGSKLPVEIRILMDGWSEFQRVMFLDRLIEARRSANEVTGHIMAPNIYVLAARSMDTPNIILLNNPRKFAIVKPI
jgi:hypothetical protein